MAIFKCKMCGGTLEIKNNETVATCEYCGGKQTLPRLDDDRRANLYDRANHFRRNNEFDKAMGIYEQILNEDNTDAEAYWSIVLCRYGIEYVEDPALHKRIPTVNRTQFTSVFDDDNYKSALQYADGCQRLIYEEEAKTINEIQKGILELSQKEEPFDIFICYKESDNSGKRTPDSVLAQEMYYQLKQEGFKVFFARITLEDTLGSAYEPHIFAALNSSKVMVVLGTKPEYFNAVWVKNEWSRYLSLIKSGENKMLIPAYKDMDPYDLPEEFSHLQAQDMSKLGFMQDLIRGIKKIVKAGSQKQNVVKETVITTASTDIAPLLKRVFIFLEDGDFSSADEYCERVLDINPECAEAYLGKLMAEMKVRTVEDLKDFPVPFNDKNNFQKAVRFGNEKLKATLNEYIEHIKARNEAARLENLYYKATGAMNTACSEEDYKKAAAMFDELGDYSDAATLAQTCYEYAETTKKDTFLERGKSWMSGDASYNYKQALELLENVSGWKDADECISICKARIEELNAKAEANRIEFERLRNVAQQKEAHHEKIITKIIAVSISILCVIIAFVIVLNAVILPARKKDAFIGEYGQGAYDKFGAFEIGDYIKFGGYEQNNGYEEIEWLVLDIKDGKALVISKYVLDCKPYNTTHTSVTWETSSLRTWLNDEFIDWAFTKNERNLIATTAVSTNSGTTNDKVFLLSTDEAEKYFKSNSARRVEVSEYAERQGAFRSWVLRDDVVYKYRVHSVNASGEVITDTYHTVDDEFPIRPALWIDLSLI